MNKYSLSKVALVFGFFTCMEVFAEQNVPSYANPTSLKMGDSISILRDFSFSSDKPLILKSLPNVTCMLKEAFHTDGREFSVPSGSKMIIWSSVDFSMSRINKFDRDLFADFVDLSAVGKNTQVISVGSDVRILGPDKEIINYRAGLFCLEIVKQGRIEGTNNWYNNGDEALSTIRGLERSLGTGFGRFQGAAR